MDSRSDEAISLLEDALAAAGAQTARPSAADSAADLLLVLGERRIPVQMKRWSTFPDHALLANPAFRQPSDPSTLRLVVADRIGERARQGLREAGWGWLDLRGSLHVQGPGVLIHSDVPATWERPTLRDPLSTPSGLAIACALLAAPREAHPVRGLARRVGRAASTVSEVLHALRDAGLVEGPSSAPASELFWQVADVWPNERVRLKSWPSEGEGPVTEALQLGFGDIGGSPGWALTDTLAAAAYGAPVAARADLPADYFVPSEAALRRARTLLGVAASPGEARATVRVGPVPDACAHRVDPAGWSAERRPLAAPLYVALDLAQDVGRGREILAGWNPPQGWTRVW